MDIVYTLAIVYNFININNLDNLDNNLEIKNKVINKEDIEFIKVESDIVKEYSVSQIGSHGAISWN